MSVAITLTLAAYAVLGVLITLRIWTAKAGGNALDDAADCCAGEGADVFHDNAGAA